MNLLRKLKISEFVQVNFTQDELNLLELINSMINDLSIFIDESYPNQINYMKPDGSLFFQQDNINEIAWVKRYSMWTYIYSNYKTYYNLNIIIRFMVFKKLNILIYKQMYTTEELIERVETRFKNLKNI